MICYVNKKDVIYILSEKLLTNNGKNSLKIAFEILY